MNRAAAEARAYNSDANSFVKRIRIFRKLPHPAVDPLGDVDVELSLGIRPRTQARIRV